MKRLVIGVAILSIFVLGLFLYNSYAQAEKLAIAAEKTVLLFMHGEVKVKSLDDVKYRDAKEGMILSKGDNLKTGIESWAEIGFGEAFKNVVRIKENTFVEFLNLDPIKLGLLKGELRSLVESLSKGTTFEIKTPTAVCGARGTGWDTATDGQKVVVDTYEHEVYFYKLSEEGSIIEDPIIKAGKRGMLEDLAKPISIGDLPAGRMKDWSEWKEDFSQRRDVAQRDAKGKEKNIQQLQKLGYKKASHHKRERGIREERIGSGKKEEGSYNSKRGPTCD